jgi:hypothetical protein
VHSQDGYKLISAEQLVAALHAFNERQITFRAFRAFIGCFELLAIREAAERSDAKSRTNGQRRFLRSELARLLQAKEGTTLSRELRSLKATGLLTFSENAIEEGSARSGNPLAFLGSRGGKRLIPVPRQVLKYLAQGTRPAVAKTVVAYLLRGLSLDRSGKIRSAGTVKISWICRLCRISERAARAARAELIRLGWITKDTGSFQRKLNRDGAYFVIDPAWRRLFKRAPLGPENRTRSAPPIEKQETPYGSKNQKPATRVARRLRAEAGVCKANGREIQERPSLRNIKLDDLRRLSRLKVLYEQATALKWLTRSEANLRNFIAAAARATRVDGDPVRVFVGIVRQALWHHLTIEDEKRAIAALKREREKQDRTSEPGAENASGEGMMRTVLDLAMGCSTTVFPYAKDGKPSAAGTLEGL